MWGVISYMPWGKGRFVLRLKYFYHINGKISSDFDEMRFLTL